ncbi:hypothetical protein WS68_18790 [Burkholderia sp. TSV86]|nr:hypothetical protein WS68_18790 [Burkholderia sp. TSV86]
MAERRLPMGASVAGNEPYLILPVPYIQYRSGVAPLAGAGAFGLLSRMPDLQTAADAGVHAIRFRQWPRS